MEKRRQTLSLFSADCPHVGSARTHHCAPLLLCYTGCGRIDLIFGTDIGSHTKKGWTDYHQDIRKVADRP